MKTERVTRAWANITSHGTDGAAPAPEHACVACVQATEMTGASLMLASDSTLLEAVCFTDSRAGKMEELQASLGQGPGIDAVESGSPTLVDDLASPLSGRRWPAFAPAAARIGVHALHSLPLALGALRVGVLDLYRDTPGQLSQDQLLDALVYADTALLLVLDARTGITTSVNGTAAASRPPLWRAEVHQAAGMVSVQMGISVLDALVRLRAHAYSHELQLTAVARAVVERRLRFAPGDADIVTDHAPGRDA
ncbi:GAF and ANTAR domain-containing protein [Amycolatopsis sp. K13G38]|uniref:GAF and ANTAR domain-containing protein n=1 Tax=Amycolatopsis acididurans TaxID=2724524 RepID=A0ABX1J2I7_9PSEU|nr:GAF and ANTAR domain-containing protein [Amycolatopsis acididurans]NKQ54015.1 GAF and ANTAR domain-containing protein [Amycolatopsis acididurans]